VILGGCFPTYAVNNPDCVETCNDTVFSTQKEFSDCQSTCQDTITGCQTACASAFNDTTAALDAAAVSCSTACGDDCECYEACSTPVIVGGLNALNVQAACNLPCSWSGGNPVKTANQAFAQCQLIAQTTYNVTMAAAVEIYQSAVIPLDCSDYPSNCTAYAPYARAQIQAQYAMADAIWLCEIKNDQTKRVCQPKHSLCWQKAMVAWEAVDLGCQGAYYDGCQVDPETLLACTTANQKVLWAAQMKCCFMENGADLVSASVLTCNKTFADCEAADPSSTTCYTAFATCKGDAYAPPAKAPCSGCDKLPGFD
jgi:hypothetical protein